MIFVNRGTLTYKGGGLSWSAFLANIGPILPARGTASAAPVTVHQSHPDKPCESLVPE
ncbi:MAG TPA: hypothetical protein VM871_04965 [Flavisolibacter sp.]|nr:hypothetical protein [Flavisolibacter sp.]